jgi:hypothetical protein
MFIERSTVPKYSLPSRIVVQKLTLWPCSEHHVLKAWGVDVALGVWGGSLQCIPSRQAQRHNTRELYANRTKKERSDSENVFRNNKHRYLVEEEEEEAQ